MAVRYLANRRVCLADRFSVSVRVLLSVIVSGYAMAPWLSRSSSWSPDLWATTAPTQCSFHLPFSSDIWHVYPSGSETGRGGRARLAVASGLQLPNAWVGKRLGAVLELHLPVFSYLSERRRRVEEGVRG